MAQNANIKNKLLLCLSGAALIFIIAGWFVFLLYGSRIAGYIYNDKPAVFFTIAHLKIWYPALTFDSFFAMVKGAAVAFTILAIIFVAGVLFKKRLYSLIYVLFKKLESRAVQQRLFSLLVFLACGITCYNFFLRASEITYYHIQDAMNFSVCVPYKHRVLFVLLADLIKALCPSVSYLKCFFVSQLAAMLLALIYIKKWAGLFITRKLTFIAQLLLTLLLISTYAYYNFYDFGVVLFSTAALLFLFKKKLLKYFLVFALGILNHEVMLLMVFVFMVLYYDSMKKSRFWGMVLLHAVLFIGIRGLLSLFIPFKGAWEDGKFWVNILAFTDPRHYLMDYRNLIFWYALALLGVSTASRQLRRSLILVPVLLVVMFFVGQICEIRVFNSLIPIVIALILSLISSILSKTQS